MGWLDWLFGKKKAAAPGWAPFFSNDEAADFLALVRSELETRKLKHTLREGAVDVEMPHGEKHALGLMNLAHRCHTLARGEWPPTVKSHFSQVLSTDAEATDVLDRAHDFETVRSILKVNVYRQLPPANELFTWPIAEGLVGCLVYDLPNTTRSVSTQDATRWGRSREQLIRLAVANATAEPVEEESVEVQAGCQLRMLGGGFFTSSNLLTMDTRIPLEHPWGALVCVPNRHTVLYHPITDIKVVAAVNTMLMLAQKLFVEGPGAISPELYWWRAGHLERLPAKLTEEAVQFMPPDDFVKVLNQLAQPN